MRFSASWLILAFALSVAARPSRQGCKVKETVDSPRGWVKQLEAPADYVIELRIALPQPNFSALEVSIAQIMQLLVTNVGMLGPLVRSERPLS